MEERVQKVAVMRHGERIDHFDKLWVSERPWDPALIEAGKARARATGVRLSGLGFPIHRVFVSPFIRCLQTAAEVLLAFPSAKVAIEYGLCEILNEETIQCVIPEDGNWFPEKSELESIFPEEAVNRSLIPIYEEMPKWGESIVDSRRRYSNIIQSLADKYPHDNLLLITHGEGVWTSVNYFYKPVLHVDYCAYSILERNISFNSSEEEFTSQKFNVLTRNNETGLTYADPEPNP